MVQKPRPRRFMAALPSALCVAYGAGLVAVMTILLFFQSEYRRYYPTEGKVGNLALMGVALLAAVGLTLLRARMLTKRAAKAASPARRERRVPWALLLADLALLAAQLVITRYTWFYAGWDVESCYAAAGEIARTGATASTYFNACPNNAPVTMLMVAPLWIADRLGLAVPYAALPYTSALLVNLACLFAALCARRATGSRTVTGFTFALCALWVGTSPFISVPYTDTFAIAFPVAALYAYLSIRKPFTKWLVVTFLCFFGFAVKPTVAILWIALVIVGALRLLSRPGAVSDSARRLAAIALAIIIGFLPAKLFKDAATTFLTGSAQPEEQLSETHYIMMGLNPDTYGGHSPSDVAFSTSFGTLSERRRANIDTALGRLRDMGAAGAARFFSIKAYKAYADGTFASNQSVLLLEAPRRSGALAELLAGMYHQGGDRRAPFAAVMQGIWMLVLLLCAFASLAVRGRQPLVPVLALALLGLSVYLLIVEVWPRYLFVYAPIFALLATLGLEGAAALVCRRASSPAR